MGAGQLHLVCFALKRPETRTVFDGAYIKSTTLATFWGFDCRGRAEDKPISNGDHFLWVSDLVRFYSFKDQHMWRKQPNRQNQQSTDNEYCSLNGFHG
jgi:hypothetical protein